jgi:hypothetical protein
MILDTDDLDAYGSLEPLFEGEISNDSKGLFILEIQDRLMKFLEEVCQAILHDKALDPESLASVPVEPDPPKVVSTTEGV